MKTTKQSAAVGETRLNDIFLTGWESRWDGEEASIYIDGNAHKWRIATLNAPDAESAKAYAALMASAPELREVVRAFLALGIRSAKTSPMGFLTERAKAAIAKGEGRA